MVRSREESLVVNDCRQRAATRLALMVVAIVVNTLVTTVVIEGCPTDAVCCAGECLCEHDEAGRVILRPEPNHRNISMPTTTDNRPRRGPPQNRGPSDRVVSPSGFPVATGASLLGSRARCNVKKKSVRSGEACSRWASTCRATTTVAAVV